MTFEKGQTITVVHECSQSMTATIEIEAVIVAVGPDGLRLKVDTEHQKNQIVFIKNVKVK